jgi:hypothetical protein
MGVVGQAAREREMSMEQKVWLLKFKGLPDRTLVDLSPDFQNHFDDGWLVHAVSGVAVDRGEGDESCLVVVLRRDGSS